MACNLTPSAGAREDFTAKTGSVVTVSVRGSSGAQAEIVHLRYAKEPIDDAEPFQFTVQSGGNFLVVLVEASKPGVMVQLIEQCGGGAEQVVDRFHFDPMNPARGYLVRGVA